MGDAEQDDAGRDGGRRLRPSLLLARLMAATSAVLTLALVAVAVLVPASSAVVVLAGAVVGLVGVVGCVILAAGLRRGDPAAALRGSAVGVLMLLAAAVLLAPAVVWLVAGVSEAFTTLGLSTVALPAVVAVVAVLAGPGLGRDG
ncbi:hypothetical protein [Arthrobacter sp. NEB 688]|uniref:hypothetical protein n=1 Tax=Arthrobacter sp. NEB 688 TaxID=904039 RepID=UPI0015635429|nr:hypothetical protein [Arthrobacter sp. NEB 688]QKE85783.1 hypothetical protein HL663_18895 [Arthrobacter sp. NEB 688]